MHIADRQLKANRFFCHEHPSGASSWRRASVAQLANKHNVFLVSFDQCRTGLRTPSGLKPIQKRTVLMTNSREIHNIFSPLQCKCTEEHAVIQGSESGLQLSSWCQVYEDGCKRPFESSPLAHSDGRRLSSMIGNILDMTWHSLAAKKPIASTAPAPDYQRSHHQTVRNLG